MSPFFCSIKYSGWSSGELFFQVFVAYLNPPCWEFQEQLLCLWVGSITFHDPQKMYFSLPFSLRKVLSQMASTIGFACRCHSFILFLFPPLGCFNSASFQSKANFLYVCRWCRIPSFYTVAGLYLMYLVHRQLSFIAFTSKFNGSPMQLVCNSFSGEFDRIISQSSFSCKKLNWLYCA